VFIHTTLRRHSNAHFFYTADEFLMFTNELSAVLNGIIVPSDYCMWNTYNFFFPMVQQPLVGQGFLIIEASWSYSVRHTTLGRTPLNEWLPWHRDLYLTTHNTLKRQTSIPPAGFKPTITASKRPQAHALGRAPSEILTIVLYYTSSANFLFVWLILHLVYTMTKFWIQWNL
jgi:hypothetical protein